MKRGRSPSGRACGPSDLSRSASQAEALVPNAICDECGGEGYLVEFRRFAGEYQAGEPIEVPCHACDGKGEIEAECPTCEGPLTPTGGCDACETSLTETLGDPFLGRHAA